MKKISIALLASMLFLKAAACDICGGGMNNMNPYLFPHLSKSYIGLSYLHNHYRLNEDGTVSNQYNNSFVVTGQYTIKTRLQVLVLLPFQSNTISTTSSSMNAQGLGDITFLVNYLAIQKNIGKTRHVISAGAGIKLPTGEYNPSKTGEIANQNFQLGSGSKDVLTNLVYRFNVGNFSLNTVGAYKYTTANKEGYRYGDVVTAGATAVYVIQKEGFSLAPYLQAVNENHYRDAANHVLQNHSGGNVLYTGAGLDVSVNRTTVGINYQLAANQNLIGGELTAKPRFSARISMTL